MNHVRYYYSFSTPFDIAVKSFRMPLYFVLSGLFFKPYEGLGGFLRRKTNKLLIPFIFFWLVSSVIWMLLSKRPLGDLMESLLIENIFFNLPIWFLLCLFEVNILFYLLYLLSRKLPSPTLCLGIMCLLCGIGGLMLSYYKINIYAYLDTSMTAMPLFFFGYYVGRETNLLRKPSKKRELISIIIVCCSVLFLFSSNVDYRTNTFSPRAYWTAYLCGICGTILVLAIAKWVRKIPLVTYYGRYSIIILCTHMVFYLFIDIILGHFGLVKLNKFAIVFGFMVFSYLAIIPLCVKFLPHVTAQKDVIR